MKNAKNVNNLLSQRIVDLERHCRANAQSLRRECLKIVGIPRFVDNNSLKEKVIQVFQKVGCTLIPATLKHVIVFIAKRNDRVIVKFSRRKDCEQVLSVKKNLPKLKMEDIGLTGDNKVLLFIVYVPTTVYSGRNQRFFSIWEKSIGEWFPTE